MNTVQQIGQVRSPRHCGSTVGFRGSRRRSSVPVRGWAYEHTQFTRAHRAVIAILDVVTRRWITTLVAAEESSTQVEVAFTAALVAEDLLAAADARATEALREALAGGERERLLAATVDVITEEGAFHVDLDDPSLGDPVYGDGRAEPPAQRTLTLAAAALTDLCRGDDPPAPPSTTDGSR